MMAYGLWRMAYSDASDAISYQPYALKSLDIFHFIDTGNFHLFEPPALFNRRSGVDTQTSGHPRLRARWVQCRASNPRNNDSVLVRLEARRHCPVDLHRIEGIDIVVD